MLRSCSGGAPTSRHLAERHPQVLIIARGRSIDYANRLTFGLGDLLWSNRSRPMLRIVEDTCGRHDFLLTPCSQETFDILYPDLGGA
ncbi:MAG: DUF1989 domain-containing protein, partial [Candidatus Phosphoribacter sp.]